MRAAVAVAAWLAVAVGATASAAVAEPVGPGGVQRYVVVLEGDAAQRPGAVAASHADRHGAEVARVLTRSVDGYAAWLSPGEAKAIGRLPDVAAVGLDPVGKPAAQAIPTDARRVFAADQDCSPGDNPLVNHNLDIDCTDDLRVDVDIAVLDTPIDPAHPDLNVVSNVDCFAGDPTPDDDDPTDHTGCDPGHGELGSGCFGWEQHGEIVALPMAAIDNQTGTVGVAPGARIWSVGVADLIPGGPNPCGDFYLSDLIAGVEWVTGHAAQIEVANMSLQFRNPTDPAGQALDQALDQALEASIANGVVYVAAAGNSSEPLTGFIPAKYNRVITATAIHDSDGLPNGLAPQTNTDTTCHKPNDQDDTNSTITNYGPAATTPTGPGADIAAPGGCTSFAAAHTTAAAALLASQNNPNNQTHVANIHNTLTTTANPNNKTNGGYNDNTDDNTPTTREPLLNVNDETAFDPTLLVRHAAPTTLDPLDTSALSAAIHGDALNLYARGTNGMLYQKWYSTSTGWSDWYGLGGPNDQAITSGTAATPHYSNFNVYARGSDGALWQRACCFGTEGWTPWWHMGGPNNQPITSSPATTKHYNNVNVYARGNDGDLWQKACCFGPEGWTPWWHMGGPQGQPITSSPAAVTHDNNNVTVYARGADGDLWQRTCCYGAEGWLSWRRLPGPHGDVVSSHPTAVVHEGILHVFVRDHDGVIHETTSSGGSGAEWDSLGAP